MSNLNKLRELEDGVLLRYHDKYLYKLSSYVGNPILKPEDLRLMWWVDTKIMKGAVFNGGATIYEDKIILMPRCHMGYTRKKYVDDRTGLIRYYMENYKSEVCVLESGDGVNFKKRDDIKLKGEENGDFKYGIEDIRIIKFENNEYFLIGCGKKTPPFKGSGGDRIAIYTTEDFKRITYRGIVDEFDSRNALIFPEYIDGKIYMIFRFHPNIHISPLQGDLDQLYNPRKYSMFWKEIYKDRSKNLLLRAGKYSHENEKIGGGPPPIKTREGWLLLYHSVGYIEEWIARQYGLSTSVPRSYSISIALLDENDPSRVRYRGKYPVYIPHKPWEYEGDKNYPVDIPYVIFPTGALIINGKLVIYAGAGDKYMVLLSTDTDSLIDYVVKYGEKLS